jgi:ABC-type lipoprotein export system ATPase subunit
LPNDVVCEGLVKEYATATGTVRALKGVDAAFPAGRVTAVVGPSGSGKSSVLGVLAGWEPPDAGQLSWAPTAGGPRRAGDPPGPRAGSREAPGWSELATVPQALGLLDDLSVRENVALPVRLRLGRRRAAEGRTEELLGLFGLAELADRSPSETSLGQQQRAAVARALVLTPQLVLADEPSAHQDAAWVHDVFAALRQVVHDRGAACLVATHDPDALQFADRVLRLADGELTEPSP